MLKKILIGIAILVAILVILAVTKPDTFSVERSVAVNAPAEAVFPLVNDFREWEAWSPWEKLDPDMTRTFSGAESGAGAVYEWSGNSDVGSGRMEIVESTRPSHVAIDLHFSEPFEAQNWTEFNMEPDGDSTRVTWVMTGNNNFVSKLMSVFMSMDDMIGGDFESGLADLKSAAEANASAAAPETPAQADTTAAPM